MAHPRMTDQELFDQLATADRDQLRLILEHGIQRLIEIEASAVIGADPYERAADRATDYGSEGRGFKSSWARHPGRRRIVTAWTKSGLRAVAA